MHIALASRNAEHLDPLAHTLSITANQCVRAYGCDATDEFSVKNLISHVARDMGLPHLVVYLVQGWYPGRAIEVEVPAFEESWRRNCLGAFIVAREAARNMASLRRGTIILIGSSSSVIGRADHLNLAVGKFGLRALSQVMARELWPEGVHVVHVIIDADIMEEGARAVDISQACPKDIADQVYALHRQASSAWTSEIDLRPWNERFWEHC